MPIDSVILYIDQCTRLQEVKPFWHHIVQAEPTLSVFSHRLVLGTFSHVLPVLQ